MGFPPCAYLCRHFDLLSDGVSESVHPRTTTDALRGKWFRELVSDLIALPYLGDKRDWESGTHEIVRVRTPRQRPQRSPRHFARRARMFRAARLIGSGRGAVRVPVRRVRVSPHSTYLGVQLTS